MHKNEGGASSTRAAILACLAVALTRRTDHVTFFSWANASLSSTCFSSEFDADPDAVHEICSSEMIDSAFSTSLQIFSLDARFTSPNESHQARRFSSAVTDRE